MAGRDDADARRGLLARLVTLVAVVAGLVVLIAPLCSDGMSMTMAHATHASAADSIGASQDPEPVHPSVGYSCPAGVAELDVVQCGAGTTSPSSSAAGSPIPGGTLLACVAFAIAVLAVAFGLRPPCSVRAVVLWRAAEERRRLLGRPTRRPALVELCVLRT
ncbi:hypothetical protein CFP66_40340 [Pseudonocardia sp. MH-G8]|nr:hypothetical protein CFP66_40340 [Pseudonocardia sp. MH-G8]